GKSRFRPDISKPEDPSTVRNYRDTVPFVSIVVNPLRILLDLYARIRNSRRIPDSEIIVRVYWNLSYNLDLSLIERMILHRKPSRSVSSFQQRCVLSQP